MPPERRPLDDPIEWLNRAKSNLARATADINLPSIYLEDLCFDAQPAAEKAIKAMLLFRGIVFPSLGGQAHVWQVMKGASLHQILYSDGVLKAFSGLSTESP